MSKKQKPCICGAGQKKSHNSKDSSKSSNKQASAWTAPPIDSELDDAADRAAKRAQRDADRLEATCDDDRRFFEAHPGRRFYLRCATPHERYAETSWDWTLVCQIAPGVRIRMPIAFERVRLPAAEEHNTEEKCAQLFISLAAHFTPENTHPALYAAIEKMREGL
jgi:hypothetical protein